jgi:hypothetical protein
MTAHQLRVLIANEREERGERRRVGALTSHEYPDVALVGLRTNSTHALELIERIPGADASTYCCRLPR